MPKYKFGDIAINITQKRKPTADDMETYIGLEHLDRGSLSVSRWGSKVPIKGEKLVMEKGDVLFGKRNAYLRRAAIAPHDGLFSAHGMVLRPNEEVISQKLFPFFICSDYFFDAAIRISVGSLSPTINWSALKELEFILPNIEEQEKHAELLWAANNTKEAYKKLLYLTDELNKAQFVEMFGDPILNPFCLPKIKMKDISELITKGASPSWQGFNYTDDTTQTLFVTSENVREGWLDLSERKYMEDGFNQKQKRSVLHRGDFLINIVGASIGRAARYELDDKANINQAVALVRVLPDAIESDYLLYYLNSPKALLMYESMKSSVARANLSLQNISDLEILLPSKEEQIKFAVFLQQSDKSKKELQQNICNLEKTIKALMSKNFG